MVDYTTSENPSSIVGGVEDIRDSIVFISGLQHELYEDLTPEQLEILKKVYNRVNLGLKVLLVNSDGTDNVPISIRAQGNNIIVLAAVFIDDDEFECSIGEFDLNTGKCLRHGDAGVSYLG